MVVDAKKVRKKNSPSSAEIFDRELKNKNGRAAQLHRLKKIACQDLQQLQNCKMLHELPNFCTTHQTRKSRDQEPNPRLSKANDDNISAWLHFFPVDFDPRLEDDVQLHVDNDDYDDDNNDDDWNDDDDDDNDVWNDGNDQDNSSAIWFIC